MTRPCTCERSRPGESFDAKRDCWKCWHWHHHAGLRAAWGGKAADVIPVRAAPPPPPRPLPVLREWTPCEHEG
ncbi:hypothetical protein J0H58_28810, partial [bacterium]|nr:hypothetical protein [bacterium]